MNADYNHLIHMPEEALFAEAQYLREMVFGKRVSLCAIINARSGQCAMDCHFCAQSSHHNSDAPTFPLLEHQTLLERLALIAPHPVARVGIVTSGGALSAEEVEQLALFLERLSADGGMQKRWKNRLCMSLGRLSTADFQRLSKAGLQRYHHNIESSQNFYPNICSTQLWQHRCDTVARAHEVGLNVCCGGIFGLGESWDDRISMALSLRHMGVTQVPMNFLHPQRGTPLAAQRVLSAEEALRIIALFRHILPTATLRVCGGAALVLQARRHHIFDAGANALMVGDYLTTKGKAIEEDVQRIKAQGFRIIM